MARHPKIVSSFHNRPIVKAGVEAATQSYVRGNFVVESSGTVTECAADAVLYSGIAEATASGTTSAVTYFRKLHTGDVLEIDCYDTSDAAQTAASGFQVGTDYGLVVVDSVHMVDFDETTAPAFTFEGVVPHLDGSTSYRGLFTILSAVLLGPTGE